MEKIKCDFQKKNEDVTGKVAINSIGRIAIITGKQQYEFGLCHVGIGLDGLGSWASKDFVIVAESAEEFSAKLSERFGGKMSYNA